MRRILRLGPSALVLVAAAAVGRTLGLRAVSPLARFAVRDESMSPAYRPGDRVVVWRLAYVRHAPLPGDAVVLRDPQRIVPLLLKRIAAPPPSEPVPQGGLYVLGDNPDASRDSRAFGFVPRRAVIGRVLFKY